MAGRIWSSSVSCRAETMRCPTTFLSLPSSLKQTALLQIPVSRRLPILCISSSTFRYPPVSVQIALADMNGDGHLDLVLQSAELTTPGTSDLNATTQSLSRATKTVPLRMSPRVAPSCYRSPSLRSAPTLVRRPPRSLSGDLNKDGVPDIVMVFNLAGTYSALSNGDGTFKQPVLSPGPQAAGLRNARRYERRRLSRSRILFPVVQLFFSIPEMGTLTQKAAMHSVQLDTPRWLTSTVTASSM